MDPHKRTMVEEIRYLANPELGIDLGLQSCEVQVPKRSPVNRKGKIVCNISIRGLASYLEPAGELCHQKSRRDIKYSKYP